MFNVRMGLRAFGLLFAITLLTHCGQEASTIQPNQEHPALLSAIGDTDATSIRFSAPSVVYSQTYNPIRNNCSGASEPFNVDYQIPAGISCRLQGHGFFSGGVSAILGFYRGLTGNGSVTMRVPAYAIGQVSYNSLISIFCDNGYRAGRGLIVKLIPPGYQCKR